MARVLSLAIALVAGCGRLAFDPLGGSTTSDGATAGDGVSVGSADASTADSAVAYVQGGTSSGAGPMTTITGNYPGPQTAGNFNFVALTWLSGFNITAMTDTAGNTYQRVSFNATQNSTEHELWYAANIAGGPTTITVTFSGNNSQVRMRFVEYAGLAKTNPIDAHVRGNGIGTMMSTPSLSTTNAHDLLVAANSTASMTSMITPQYTLRQSSGGSILEDHEVFAAGPFAASATGSTSAEWLMELVAIRAAP